MQKLKKIRDIFHFAYLAILITIFLLGCLWGYVSYKNFYRESAKLRSKYISYQKDLIKNEVNEIVKKIEYRKSKTEEKVKQNVKNRTYEAYDIAMEIYKENKNSKGKSEIQRIIIETLSKLNYNKGRDYYFGGKIEDGVLLLTNNLRFQGKNVLRYQDTEGRYIFKDMINIVSSEGEGFYEYMWERPGYIGKGYRKISYVKRLELLNLWIGTGEYYVDFQHELQQELLEEISRVSSGEKYHIFVGNFSGINLISKDKTRSYLFWKNWWELEDSKGIKIVQDFKKAAEKKDGDFVNYSWYKSSKKKPVERIAFVKGISDWKWMLGAEIYLDEVEDIIASNKAALKDKVTKNTIKVIFVIFFLTISAILFEMCISKKIKNINRNQEIQYF